MYPATSLRMRPKSTLRLAAGREAGALDGAAGRLVLDAGVLAGVEGRLAPLLRGLVAAAVDGRAAGAERVAAAGLLAAVALLARWSSMKPPRSSACSPNDRVAV